MKKPDQLDKPAETRARDGAVPPAAGDDETQELRTLSIEEFERRLAEHEPPKG